ncbi:MAG: hypothetical protein WC997_08090 [Porticoccaceae bacterium]
MNHSARNPSSRAAAYRAMARAALRSNSSQSVRQRRYSAAMAKAHAIEDDLRRQAQRHRRFALAALRADSPASFRLSRYWSHVGQARALEAMANAGQGGAK